MRKQRTLILGFAVQLLFACGEGDAGGWAGTIDTLANGTVLVSNPYDPLWGPSEGWTVTEELRIGAVEGDGPEVFGALKEFVVDGEGRMYILDRQAQDIRVFDANGHYVRTIGRRGGGPGEFENVWGMAFAPDGSLWVIDTGNARFSVFDTAGAFVASMRRDISGWNYIWPGIFDDDGKLLDYFSFSARESYLKRVDVGLVPPPMSEGDVSAGAALGDAKVSWTRDSLRMDVLDSNIAIPSIQESFILYERGSERRYSPIPFAPSIAWLLDSRGYLWFGKTDEYRLHQRQWSGDTIRIIEVAAEPRTVTDADRDSVLNMLEETKATGFKTDFRQSEIPETKPFFENINLDDQNYLWLWVDALENQTVYDVFDPDGRYLGKVRVPFSVVRWQQPAITETHFFGITRDELDVQYLVRARIGRGDAS